MGDGTKIEWTNSTWNIVTGCSVKSPGCKHCYAMRLAGTRLQHHPSRAGLTVDSKAGPVWTGEVRFNEQWLEQPLRWTRPRMVFVAAHGDLFHENVPDQWIDRVFAVMALAPQHTFQVLTKRAERMRDYMTRLHDEPVKDTLRRLVAAWPRGARIPSDDIMIPLPNVWLGVSAEDQPRADERIPDLLATPAAVRWVSAEPLLGPISLERITDPATGEDWRDRLDWLVAGGESGPGARPMHPDWPRSLRDQCQAAGVAFHFKQWGAWAPANRTTLPPRLDLNFARLDGGQLMRRVGKAAAGRLLDGREWSEYPR